MYLDLTMSEFWEYINSLKLYSLMNYYFLVYIFTNLASRALNFEFKTSTLDLGHNFIFTLILISIFHLMFSLRMSLSSQSVISTSLIEVAILFTAILWVLGKWVLSSEGVLKALSTKILLQNKQPTKISLQEEYDKTIANIESQKDEILKSQPDIDINQIISDQKLKTIDYESINQEAKKRANEFRNTWVILLSEIFIIISVFINTCIINTITEVLLVVILLIFIKPKIMEINEFYKSANDYVIPVK